MDTTPSLLPTLNWEEIQPERPVKLIVATEKAPRYSYLEGTNPLWVIAWRITGSYYFILRRPHCVHLGDCTRCWEPVSVVHALDELPGMDFSFSDMQHIHLATLTPKERRTLLEVAGHTLWTEPVGRRRELMPSKDWIAAVLRNAAGAGVIRRELVELCIDLHQYTRGANQWHWHHVDVPQTSSPYSRSIVA